MPRLSRLIAPALCGALLAAAAACGGGGTGSVGGEVRFAREVALPDGAVVTVILIDSSLADAPATELARDVIPGAGRLPVRFRIEYDPGDVSAGREYTLSAAVRRGDELLYVNDTVHPVLTRGAPANRDVVVVSTNPLDSCVEPLPGVIHSSFDDGELPAGAVLHVQLVDVTDPAAPVVITETRVAGPGRFPIAFELPPDGVQVSRHRRYELEADVVSGGETVYHIPRAEWRRTRLAHCPNEDLPLVNDVFPVSEFPRE